MEWVNVPLSLLSLLYQIIGSTGNNSFLAVFVILAILSVARMEITCFDVNGTIWSPWLITSLSLGALYVLIAWLIGCITQNFTLIGPIWVYDKSVPLVEPISHLEVVVCCVSLFLSYLSHVMISYNVYKVSSVERICILPVFPEKEQNEQERSLSSYRNRDSGSSDCSHYLHVNSDGVLALFRW